MDQESINLIIQYLDKVGEKIGVAGNQVWPWLIRQQYVESIGSIICFLFFSIIFFILLYNTLKTENFLERNEDAKDGTLLAFLIVSAIGFFISLIFFVTESFDIFNPEYWALKDLLNMLNPVK